jgi:hypothetical protein
VSPRTSQEFVINAARQAEVIGIICASCSMKPSTSYTFAYGSPPAGWPSRLRPFLSWVFPAAPCCTDIASLRNRNRPNTWQDATSVGERAKYNGRRTFFVQRLHATRADAPRKID